MDSCATFIETFSAKRAKSWVKSVIFFFLNNSPVLSVSYFNAPSLSYFPCRTASGWVLLVLRANRKIAAFLPISPSAFVDRLNPPVSPLSWIPGAVHQPLTPLVKGDCQWKGPHCLLPTTFLLISVLNFVFITFKVWKSLLPLVYPCLLETSRTKVPT